MLIDSVSRPQGQAWLIGRGDEVVMSGALPPSHELTQRELDELGGYESEHTIWGGMAQYD